MPILSLTTTPPVSIGALKFTSKSRRLISVVAVKPAREPPYGSGPKPLIYTVSGTALVTSLRVSSPSRM
jgi:hypothetical protein